MNGCPSSLIGNEPVTLSEGLSKLINEHIPLRVKLEALFALCERVRVEEEKKTPYGELVQKVKDFSQELEFHSLREEEILFRMMEVYLGKNGGPITVMEYEHEQAKGYISEFLKDAENVSAIVSEEMINRSTLIKNAYHTLLSHFSKEEQVLYPMAEKLFSEEEKETLTQRVSK